VREAEADPGRPTWRAEVRRLPPLPAAGLRPAQAEGRHSRSLVQMATGAGKTYAAVTESHRLLKHGGFHRVLFLVDRNNLGRQTLREFQATGAPGGSGTRRWTRTCSTPRRRSTGR
jgi:type I restriction enzyme R subunit